MSIFIGKIIWNWRYFDDDGLVSFCLNILYNFVRIQVFGRFLQEFYDHDDLLFFLYVRSVLAKVLHISFKARWQKKFDGVSGQPKALWISYKEAAHVARIVFGSDNEGLFRDFMRLITPQMVGEKTASGDTRRIDITEYLHLSVVGYHQSQNQQNQNQGKSVDAMSVFDLFSIRCVTI